MRCVAGSSRVRGGVTLIEAIIALVILVSAFGAALQVRAQLLASASGSMEAQRVARLQEGVFRELVAGTLGEGELVDDSLRFDGEYLGERFTVVARPERVENPVDGAVPYPVWPEVGLLRYEVEIAGSTATFLWHERR